MKVSVVLATVDRTDDAVRFLASLAAQSYRDFELIVADQNSDDRLLTILEPYRPEFPIRQIRLDRRGASRARNAGLDSAEGEVVCFPDDDCEYQPDTLEKVVKRFAENPGVACVTGPSVGVRGEVTNGDFDPESGLVSETNVWRRGIEYTMFFRRADMGGIRFDEEFGPGAGTPWGAGEGTDCLLKLLQRGSRIYYDTDIGVIHPDTMAVPDARTLRKAYSYGCGMGRVLKQNRSPLWLKAMYLIRPLGGGLLSLLILNIPKSSRHWNTFQGRLQGLIS